MAKTEILTKDGLTIYDEKMKSYIKEKIDDTVYIDPEEESPDLPDIEDVTAAKFVSYNNADSGLEARNVQEAIDELKESIGSGSGETVNIVDNLESTSADSALSANQGRVVNKKVDEVNDYLQRTPSKNLLEVTFTAVVSSFGTTSTVNADKSISLSGTQIGTGMVYVVGEAYLRTNTEYILSGCPQGGSKSTYYLMIRKPNGMETDICDTGEGATFTVEEDGIYTVITKLVLGVNYDGIVLYPMIRLASIEDDTYEPYYEDAMTIVNSALVHGDIVDNLSSSRTDLPLSANQGRLLKNDVNFLGARWLTQSTGVKGTVTFTLPTASVLLFCEWGGANLYAIYYVNMKTGIVAPINKNSDEWTVTISDNNTKLNISNENGNNQWADYRVLRID